MGKGLLLCCRAAVDAFVAVGGAQNTEGEYSGLEHEIVPGVVESLKVITRVASTRVAEYAFKYARDHGRRKVTAVHKANIMKKTDGLFIECTREVSQRYDDIEYDEMIVDNTCMQARASLAAPLATYAAAACSTPSPPSRAVVMSASTVTMPALRRIAPPRRTQRSAPSSGRWLQRQAPCAGRHEGLGVGRGTCPVC